MMKYIQLGSGPVGETLAKTGDPKYRVQALAECHRYIELLRQVFGKEPGFTMLEVAGIRDSVNGYYQVVCCYNSKDKVSTDYAFRCAREAPVKW